MSGSQAELLTGLSPAQSAQVMALATSIRVPSGSTLFELGAAATHLFVVEHGRISLTLPMHVCKREQDVLIEERVPGQAIGWSALIPPHRFTLKATALLDSEVLSIPRDSLAAYFETHPDIGYVVTRNAAEMMGQRLQVFQAMWLREMQRVVELRTS
jgi:CRP/FNR family transcriptional regulator, nitrogen oxide reductase regulator